MNTIFKIGTIEEIVERLAPDRAIGRTVSFANGIFDLLHVGHVRYLEAAADEGQILVVGINSDASTRGLKGEGRPILPQLERAEIVAGLACVDHVFIFEEPDVVRSRSSMRTLAGSSSMTRIRAAPRTSPTAITLARL